MEVTHAAEKRVSWRRIGYTVTAGVAVSAVMVSPLFVFPSYARVLTTLIVVCVFGAAGRLAWVTICGYRTPPHAPSIDGECPTVSIVVTAYDEADVLRETLQALHEVDYPAEKLDVLVCYEKASSDATANIACAAAANTSYIRAVERSEPPAGKAAVTNFGIAHATGEIIGVIDADQQFEPDAIRRAVGWFHARDDIWCVTGRRYGRNPKSSLVALHATVEHHLVERFEFYSREVTGGFTLFTGGQAFFRAALFDTVGPFAEDVLLEDVEMACRIHALGKDVHVDPGIVSTEVNPVTISAWWHQRVRWARGGLQVGRQHLTSLIRSPATSISTKVEALGTFVPLFLVPLLALATPVILLAPVGIRSAPYAPTLSIPVLFGSMIAASVLSSVVFIRDARDCRGHATTEFLVPLTLWAYALVQIGALVTAFLDEFVRSESTVYITS